MFMTRRRHFSISKRSPQAHARRLDTLDSSESADPLLLYESSPEYDFDDAASTSKTAPKVRHCCGARLLLPNTSRFRNSAHSRLLQKFPFLIEMFYWIINYAFYRFTSIASQRIFAKTGIWNVAQSHGIAVLEAEQFGLLSFLFSVRERDVQQWFMHGHQDALTVLNKAYALIHIPGTVG